MDGNRFDDATRALTTNAPRRGVLGLLLGSALGLAGLAGSAAKGGKGKGNGKKHHDKPCGDGEKRCGTDCVNVQSNHDNCGDCGIGCSEVEECIARQCVSCPGSQKRCPDGCFDLTSDDEHCGSCTTNCKKSNQKCINSFCTCAGPLCEKFNGEQRCCPATNGVCCGGRDGTCCPSGQFCTELGNCCPNGEYDCGDGLHCCPIGRTCRGDRCTLL